MGSLSNLYISQSYQSLIHLGNDNSASATQIELQDGVGQGLGVYVNTNGDVTIDGALIVSGTFDIEGRIIINDSVRVNGNLEVSGSTKLTGSLVVSNQLTASNAFIQNDLNVGGTLFASKVVTLIESASIIFSSGSNILGDETSDTQTLIGSVIMSGSASLTGSMGISNNLNVGGAGTFGGTGSFVGNLTATGNISSSTISGIGNVTTYSQSVDARLDFLEGPFSTSVDARLDIVEATASLYIPFSTSVDSRLDIVEATASLYVPFSQSVDQQLTSLENFTSSTFVNFSQSVDSRLDFLEGPFSTSVDARLDAVEAFTASQGLVTTSSFNAYTQSVANTLVTLTTTASFNAYTQSANARLSSLETTSASLLIETQNLELFSASTITRLNGLASFTGSYATTGSNVFRGSEVFSGSVRGQVFPITITSNTASMDCSLGNFFTLNLPAGLTRLEATNILPGETLSLRITNQTTASLFSGSAAVKFPTGFNYSPTAISASTDIITFLSFDNSVIFAVAANHFA